MLGQESHLLMFLLQLATLANSPPERDGVGHDSDDDSMVVALDGSSPPQKRLRT